MYDVYVCPTLWVTSFPVSVSVSEQLRLIVSGIRRLHGIGVTLPLTYWQPMKHVTKNWRDVLILASTKEETAAASESPAAD